MSLFVDSYKKLLIVQYADKTNANAHVGLFLSEFEKVYNLVNSFDKAFDLDTAVGKQLDIIGKIVGINRQVPFAVPKNYFGFAGHLNAYPMDDKFLTVITYPMRDKFEIPYSSSELNDNTYRFFIKAQIIKNYSKATMIDTNNLSIQNAVDYPFNNKAYMTDNKNMTMNIYINNTFDFNMIQYINQLDIIPRPQGVRYSNIISYVESETFGFNPNNKGFGDKFGAHIDSYYAIKIL